MNLLLLLFFAAAELALLWLVQAAILWRRGDVQKLPLRHGSEAAAVRWSMKIALQLALVGLALGYPRLIGCDPLAYHCDKLQPLAWRDFVAACSLTLLMFVVVLAIEIACGWVRLTQLHGARKTAGKIARSFLTPIPLVIVEESIFRGVILEQFCAALPATQAGKGAAVALAAAVFASVHFLKPQQRLLLPALGLFGLGCVLGTLYLAGEHTYWLPAGVHAGGVLGIQLHRPFAEYRGPGWLIGFRSYPIAGVIGMAGLIAVTCALV